MYSTFSDFGEDNAVIGGTGLDLVSTHILTRQDCLGQRVLHVLLDGAF